jgi:hypothetical protein
MKHEENDEDFWAWGETSKSEKPRESSSNQDSSKEVNSETENGGTNLRKQSSSDFDESWGWEDDFTAKPKESSSISNGKKSTKAKGKQNSRDANGWSEEGNDDWGQSDSWSNEDWSSVTPKNNTRQAIRSAGNGKKGD